MTSANVEQWKREIAAAAELAAGKTSRRPVVLVRGVELPAGEGSITRDVVIRLDERQQDGRVLEEIRGILSRHRGECSVCLELAGPDQSVTKVRTDSSFSVTPDASFVEEVGRLLGEGRIEFKPLGPRKQPIRNGGRNWPRN
jgi:hypothetical protein